MRDWLQLSDKQQETMADLMLQVSVQAGATVCEKGDAGETFYIVQEGVLEVMVDMGQSELTLAKCLRAGDSFGELALLYNTPRKATVRAARDSVLWSITRPQFCVVMKLKSDQRVKRYLELVNTVPLLADRLNKEERSVLADTLEEVFFVNGEEVVRQGEPGDTFFIVFEGECEVRVDGKVKASIATGGYFGERALLDHEPRAATITISSETATLLALDSTSFDLILYRALEDHKGLSKATSGDKQQTMDPKDSDSRLVQHRESKELIRAIIQKKRCNEVGGLNEIPLERLTQIGILGQGTYGSVTLRVDALTGSMYALKAMSRAFIRKEKLKHMVRNEKKTLQLLDSDFVVKLYRTYMDHQHYYLLLEPVLGGELFQLYDNHKNLFGSSKHARFYICCSALGLRHIHSLRIIYRDLKMENVLLHTNGYALLTDMGCAKMVVGKTYTVCGTTDYFAPETLKRTGHNRAVDWWALGVLLFTMMSGRSPFDSDDVLQIYRNINKGFKAETFPISFDDDLVSVIKGLCRRKPEERLGMGSDAVEDFQRHPFFKDFSWKDVANRDFKVPFRPPGIDLQEVRARQPAQDLKLTQTWKKDADDESTDSEF